MEATTDWKMPEIAARIDVDGACEVPPVSVTGIDV